MTRRVVIAEDEAIIRFDLKEILLDEGYDVVGETGRGDEAVELVRAPPARTWSSSTSRCRVPTGSRRPGPSATSDLQGGGADPHRLQPAQPHRRGPRRRGGRLSGQAVPADRAHPRHRPGHGPLRAGVGHRRRGTPGGQRRARRPAGRGPRTSSRPDAWSTGPRRSSWSGPASPRPRPSASSRRPPWGPASRMIDVARQVLDGTLVP